MIGTLKVSHRSQIRELTVDNAKKTLHTKQQRYLGEGFSIIFNNRPARYQWVNYSTVHHSSITSLRSRGRKERSRKGGRRGILSVSARLIQNKRLLRRVGWESTQCNYKINSQEGGCGWKTIKWIKRKTHKIHIDQNAFWRGGVLTYLPNALRNAATYSSHL